MVEFVYFIISLPSFWISNTYIWFSEVFTVLSFDSISRWCFLLSHSAYNLERGDNKAEDYFWVCDLSIIAPIGALITINIFLFSEDPPDWDTESSSTGGFLLSFNFFKSSKHTYANSWYKWSVLYDYNCTSSYTWCLRISYSSWRSISTSLHIFSFSSSLSLLSSSSSTSGASSSSSSEIVYPARIAL